MTSVIICKNSICHVVWVSTGYGADVIKKNKKNAKIIENEVNS